MVRVLVTGGTGSLGRELVPLLLRAGFVVRVLSRRPKPASAMPGIEWARADLRTDGGLKEALAEVNVVVHAATSPFRQTAAVDVDGTGRVLELSAAARVEHFLYPSIAGIDRIPFPYYRHKRAAEAVVRDGGLPWTILRATQFHSLIDGFLSDLARVPVFLVLPGGFRFQSLDAGEAATRIVECVRSGPAGALPDFGGPEVLPLIDIARLWLEARGIRRRPVQIRLPGAVARAFRQGWNTAPDRATGKITWREWLEKRYGRKK